MRRVLTARRTGVVVACVVLLPACGRSSQSDPVSIRAEVSALSDPTGWVRDGGVHYDCEGVNLDCTNTSSGLRFATTESTAAACTGLVEWINSTGAFVDPTGVVGLTVSATPTVDGCVSELSSRGRYLVKAGGRPSVSRSPSLGWQVLATSAPSGARLSAILGDPPEPVSGPAS
jgi:hypothetical protein